MTSVLKPMFGQASYFFEKHFKADCLIWTILFMAFCCAIVAVVLAGGAEALWKRKRGRDDPSFMGGSMAICTVLSFPVNVLLDAPFIWVSKLQRVMSNSNYVLSFDSNLNAFLGGLGLENNEHNKE